jgi:hypothetical protein
MKIGGLRVDTQEVHGPFCKVVGIKEFPDLIYNGKFCGSSLRCGGPRAAPVHGGPRTGTRRRLTGNGAPVCGTSPRLRKKGEGTAVSLTGCKRGRRRGGNGRASVEKNRWRRRSVRAVLGCGEKRREVGRGSMKPEVGALPFIGVGEGHAGARRGEMAGGNGLNAIDGGWLNEGLRIGIKRGNQGGE